MIVPNSGSAARCSGDADTGGSRSHRAVANVSSRSAAVGDRGSARTASTDRSLEIRSTVATRSSLSVIARRYLAPQDVEGYVARWSDLRTIVTITPDHVVSWSAGG